MSPPLPYPHRSFSSLGPPGLPDPQGNFWALGQLAVQLLVFCSADRSRTRPVPWCLRPAPAATG